MFSGRTPKVHATNRLTRALAERAAPPLDLTVSNPTAVGLHIPGDPLAPLADPRGRLYAPEPTGSLAARRAVAAYYARRAVAADPARIVLAASSSEAYGWLFKLLCDPGEAVLVPAPSYPLLDALAGLESVRVARYPLDPAGGWAFHAGSVEVEIDRLAARGMRTGAVVLVAPNNPTGSGVARGELLDLLALARRRGFAVVSDEVFLDYRFAGAPDDVPVAAALGAEGDGLVFSLGGLSKAAALPQLKLGWLLAGGPDDLVREALSRLEWIADAYLSAGTPVQLALPELFAWGEAAAAAIRARVLANHAVLSRAFPPGGSIAAGPLRGGWSALLRVPAVEPEEDLALRLLSEVDLLVHPGYFFDFPTEGFLVLSLLPRPDLFAEGVARLSRALSR
ncbi:MAG TPA: pyridoxal phosphate-dependent aminotransferase [Thermoanaerobaculia bacterium]|nr:pyridoxal phosphate-dependent aminotransferase [Thermoanaerobaculia bacterium]